ncbi:hypothetical protein PFLUV_G00233610 [Perca fluviatilis]|uniref:Uncharacterized protein n=1 Tax=Perca fluviatilis TaxID=8168 RepID=A0A6A5DYA0_PERFL|nr:hypothetical protein PFLUV_G00233610 [Perca fluviatilis]
MLTTVLTFFNCLWVLTENTLNFSDRIPVAFKGCQKYCRPKDSPKRWFMCRDRVKNSEPDICQLFENFYSFSAGRTENGKLPELVSEEDTNSGGSCAKIARLIPG